MPSQSRSTSATDLIETIRAAVVDGPGTTAPSVRRAAFGGGEVSSEASAYVDKVRRHAYKVTDADVNAVKDSGYSEDEIFEITVAAAVGAGYRRFEAGRKALER